MRELLIVDNDDCVVGYGEKLQIHKDGTLHRAFSIFLFDIEQNAILLQCRAQSKYHSAGLWSNSCCSHPIRGESLVDTLNSRLKEELGLVFREVPAYNDDNTTCNPYIYCGKFHYYASFHDLTEHEIDHVYVCCIDKIISKTICPNSDEVSDWKWVQVEEVIHLIRVHPEYFSAWFAPAFALAYTTIFTLQHNKEMIAPQKLTHQLIDQSVADVISFTSTV